jgi:uncharacterized Zn finger protein (UPF0148 family)
MTKVVCDECGRPPRSPNVLAEYGGSVACVDCIGRVYARLNPAWAEAAGKERRESEELWRSRKAQSEPEAQAERSRRKGEAASAAKERNRARNQARAKKRSAAAESGGLHELNFVVSPMAGGDSSSDANDEWRDLEHLHWTNQSGQGFR